MVDALEKAQSVSGAYSVAEAGLQEHGGMGLKIIDVKACGH